MRKRIYSTERWKRARAFVRKRDKGRCRDCNLPGQEVHHLVPVGRLLAEGGVDNPQLYDPSGLLLLCRSCHSRRHRLHSPLRESPELRKRREWLERSITELGGG